MAANDEKLVFKQLADLKAGLKGDDEKTAAYFLISEVFISEAINQELERLGNIRMEVITRDDCDIAIMLRDVGGDLPYKLMTLPGMTPSENSDYDHPHYKNWQDCLEGLDHIRCCRGFKSIHYIPKYFEAICDIIDGNVDESPDYYAEHFSDDPVSAYMT